MSFFPEKVKSIFVSKTFWFNLITLAASADGYLPAKYAVPVVSIANILLRLYTSSPVSVTAPVSIGK